MVKPPFVAVLALAISASLATSILVAAQQTTPPPTPTAKPSATAKATPSQTKPTAPPKTGATAPKPSPSPTPPPKPPTDVRLKTSFAHGAEVSENVTYLQGARQRVEFPGVVSIDQCDLKRSVTLNPTTKKYRVQPYPEGSAEQTSSHEPAGQQGQPTKGGVVTLTTTLTDTLERETMFGFEARHVKTLTVKELGQHTCDRTPVKIEVDAWYVDLPPQTVCPRPQSPPPPPQADACTDRVETRTVGDVTLGFPVKSSTTTTTGEGDKAETTSTSQTVTELEITRLDKALFEVPADYVEAKSSEEIVPALGSGGLADAVLGSTVDGTSAAAPKKAGVTRIGVLEPVNRTDSNLSGRSMRQDVVAKLNKGPFDALPLAGSSPAEIEKEAARLQCDYILLTEITDIRSSSGGFGSKLKKVSGGGDKPKTEVKLDYKLFAVDATQVPKFTGKTSATTGGFGVGSALHLATFAGQMYLNFMGMGMLSSQFGGLGGLPGLGGLGGGMYDPRASAIASMATSLTMSMMKGGGPGGGDPSEQDVRDTVTDALGNAAKASMDQLTKKK